MLDALHRAAVFCDQRIGWNRIGVALSLTIIAVAAVVLYRILLTIDASEVKEALLTADLRNVALAALFVAGGYFTLTFYDLFALRTIGRNDVPYGEDARAACTSD
jgi:glycosyltransferase 2 family protein